MLMTRRNLGAFVAAVSTAAFVTACAPKEEAPPPTTQPPAPVELSVSVKTELAAPAAEVWKIVGDFGSLASYMDGVDSVSVEGEGVGAVRTINLDDGGSAVETLESHDDETMTLSYSSQEGPLPVEDYLSTMRVTATGEGRSQLEWSSKFKAKGASDADAKSTISGIYQTGFDGLARELGPDEEETAGS